MKLQISWKWKTSCLPSQGIQTVNDGRNRACQQLTCSPWVSASLSCLDQGPSLGCVGWPLGEWISQWHLSPPWHPPKDPGPGGAAWPVDKAQHAIVEAIELWMKEKAQTCPARETPVRIGWHHSSQACFLGPTTSPVDPDVPPGSTNASLPLEKEEQVQLQAWK